LDWRGRKEQMQMRIKNGKDFQFAATANGGEGKAGYI
jgi:hypothetical protein